MVRSAQVTLTVAVSPKRLEGALTHKKTPPHMDSTISFSRHRVVPVFIRKPKKQWT